MRVLWPFFRGIAIRLLIWNFVVGTGQWALAQRTATYEFNQTLGERTGSLPALKPLGKPGRYALDRLPELGNQRRVVYLFDRNCGLQFDNSTDFLNGSFTVELYFRFDALNSWKRVIDFKNRLSDDGCYIFNGKLNFYNYIVGENAPVRPGEYTHYVFSRDAATRQIRIYVDGTSKIQFTDPDNVAEVGNVLNFFYDDLRVPQEASSGAVALLRFYDSVVAPELVRESFASLKNRLAATPKLPAVALPRMVVTAPAPPKPVRLVRFVPSVANRLTGQPLPDAALVLRDGAGQVVPMRVDSGSRVSYYALPAGVAYAFEVSAAGFQSFAARVNLHARNAGRDSYFGVMLDPLPNREPVVVRDIRFERSTAALLPGENAELDRLAGLMQADARLRLELLGHTDNLGDFDACLRLSQERVAVVKTYLVGKGIAENRISGRGYGSTRPAAANSREETRSLNRRVEVRVTRS